MNAQQWVEIANQVESFWGRSQKWANASKLAGDRHVNAANYAAAVAHVETLLMQGTPHAPSPAEILGNAQPSAPDHATAQKLAAATCKQTDHLFGYAHPTMLAWEADKDWPGSPVGHVELHCGRCGHSEHVPLERAVADLTDSRPPVDPERSSELAERIAP